MTVEVAMLDLERALGYLSFTIGVRNKTPYERACQVNGWAQRADWHKLELERERYERIEAWRRKHNSNKGRK